MLAPEEEAPSTVSEGTVKPPFMDRDKDEIKRMIREISKGSDYQRQEDKRQ